MKSYPVAVAIVVTIFLGITPLRKVEGGTTTITNNGVGSRDKSMKITHKEYVTMMQDKSKSTLRGGNNFKEEIITETLINDDDLFSLPSGESGNRAQHDKPRSLPDPYRAEGHDDKMKFSDSGSMATASNSTDTPSMSDRDGKNSVPGISTIDDLLLSDNSVLVLVTYDEIYRVTVFLIAVHFMGSLCTVVNLPALIGQLVTGVILGPPLTGFVPIEKGLVMLGEIGLIFNMFEVGIELDVALLQRTGTRAVAMSFLGAALALGTGIGVGIAFDLSFQGAFALGSIFAQTSSATLVPMLKSGKLLNTPVGQMILAATIIDDLISLILLSIMEVFVPIEGISFFEYFVPVLTSIAWLAVLGMIAITLAPRIIENLILPRIPRQDSKHFVLFALMCAIFAAYLPLLHYTKSSYLIGAFLCGASFSQVGEAHDIFFEKGQGFIDWGYKLFFAAKLGFQVPVKLFGNPSVWILGSVLVSAVAIKFLCALVVPKFQKVEERARYNPNRHDQIVAGLSMMNRGGLGFLLASFAVDRNIIDLETYASAIVALLFGIFVPAYILTFAIRRHDKIYLNAQEASHLHSFEDRRSSIDGKMPFYMQIHLETKEGWGHLEKIAHEMNSIGLQVENFNSKHRKALNPVIISDLFLRDSTMQVMIPNIQVKLAINSFGGANEICRSDSTMVEWVSDELSLIEKRCIEILTLVQDKIKQFKPTVVKITQWNPFDVDNALDTMILSRANGQAPSPEFFQGIFALMDDDNDGFLTKDELKRGMMDANFEISDEGFEILVRSIDSDGDGIVSLDDWSDTVELFLQKKKQPSTGTDLLRQVGSRTLRFDQMTPIPPLDGDEEKEGRIEIDCKELSQDDDDINIVHSDNEEIENDLSHGWMYSNYPLKKLRTGTNMLSKMRGKSRRLHQIYLYSPVDGDEEKGHHHQARKKGERND